MSAQLLKILKFCSFDQLSSPCPDRKHLMKRDCSMPTSTGGQGHGCVFGVHAAVCLRIIFGEEHVANLSSSQTINRHSHSGYLALDLLIYSRTATPASAS